MCNKTKNIIFNLYSPQEQISALKEHGINIGDKTFAEHFLENVSFCRFQEYLFLTHAFKNSFEESYRLYNFDKNLKFIIFQAVEIIEISLRAHWVHNIGHKYGENFLEKGHYAANQKSSNTLENIKAAIQDNKQGQAKQEPVNSKTLAIKIPDSSIARASEFLSFGQISLLIKNLKHREDRNSIAHAYGLDEVVFISLLENITIIRNICAHHRRLWNKWLKRVPFPKKDTFAIECLQESLNKRPDIRPRQKQHSRIKPPSYNPKEKIYNGLCYIIYLLKIIAPQYSWKDLLKKHIHNRPAYAALNFMGFPQDWEERSLWR